MNLEKSLRLLISYLSENQIRYALIGGYAMGFWGIHRATDDIDFLILTDDLAKTSTLKELDFECVHEDDEVSQFAAPVAPLGSVDILHAQRPRALKILERAVHKEAFGGNLQIKVACVEDLIGLKLQAYSNTARKNPFDLADIEALLQNFGERLNREILLDYFKLFHQQDLWQKLKEKYKL